jgi:hypothetical protein
MSHSRALQVTEGEKSPDRSRSPAMSTTLTVQSSKMRGLV